MTEVKKFGLLFGVISSGVSIYVFLKGGDIWPWFALCALFFFGTGLFAQKVLRPVYVVWMKFAYALAWVNTRVLLSLFYYLVMTPTGLVMRLLGKDFLDERIDKRVPTYWVKRTDDEFDRSRYLRLF
ncbi:MAG: hypothetical protein KAJ12_04615 [Bacteroidetes bacterium]|nr:hypothetical protein [Bacteroidota bacterium]